MGRLAAKTDADREMHKHLRASVQSLRHALAVTVKSSKEGDPVVCRRARELTTRLKVALGVLENIGTMQPNWDMTDPDLSPEDQRGTRLREQPLRPVPVVAGEDD